MTRGKNKEFYAVVKGRIDEPTIFSSWGDAHPRVTGCRSEHQSFFTIEEARKWMKTQGVTSPKEIIKDGAGETTPMRNSDAFYAVADGIESGIYLRWYGDDRKGAKPEVNKISGNCHKHFRTESQAQAFIKDWKQSYADVHLMALKQALDRGWRPKDMNIRFADEMQKPKAEAGNTNTIDELNMSGLTLTED